MNPLHLLLTRRRFLSASLASPFVALLPGCARQQTPPSTTSPPPTRPPAREKPTEKAGGTAIEGPYRLAVSRDGALAAVDVAGEVQIWSVKDGKRRTLTSPDHGETIRALALSPDGKYLALGWGNELTLMALPEGRPVGASLNPNKAEVRALAFTPDGKWLASGDVGGLICLFTIPGGKSKTVANVYSAVNALAVTPDGKYLATGSGFLKGELSLWTLPEGKAAGKLPGHEYSVTGLAVAPDGAYLASATRGKVRLWPLPNPKEATAIMDNGTGVNDMTFVQGGKLLACAGDDGMIRLWSVPEGKANGSLKGPHGPAVAVAALAGRDETLLAADTAGSLWVADLRERSWKPLSPNP